LAILVGSTAARADPLAGFSPEGNLIVVATDGGGLSVWSVETRSKIDGANAPVLEWKSVSLSADGGLAAALALDAAKQGKLVIWDRRLKAVRVFDAPFANSRSSFFDTPLWQPQGHRLILRRESGEPAYLVDATDGKVLAAIEGTIDNPFSPDGKYLISKSADGRSLLLHDAATGVTERTIAAPMRIRDARFVSDGIIATMSINCEIIHSGVTSGEASWDPVRAADDNCSLSRIAEDGVHAVVEINSNQWTVLSLATGKTVYAAPSKDNISSVEVTAGYFLSAADDRPLARSLDGKTSVDLPVSRSYFDNNYRSRVVAGGRLLSNFPDEPIRIFALVSGDELLCVDAAVSCAVGRLRANYGAAVRAGRPADIVRILTAKEADEITLGPEWGSSRTALADSYLLLGERQAARSVLEGALISLGLADRSQAQLRLAAFAAEDGEPSRALGLVEALIRDIDRAGADPQTTTMTLVRRSNGLRIGLGPADIVDLKDFLSETLGLGEIRAGSAAVTLDEEQYSKLMKMSGVTGARELAAIGFEAGLSLTERRMALLRAVGDAETMRAGLLLERSRGEAALDSALAAQLAIERFSTFLDSERNGLALDLRIRRQNLRADILRRLGDIPAAVATRDVALAALAKRDRPNPFRLAQINRSIAEDRVTIGAFQDAADNLSNAKAALRGKAPDDSMEYLLTIAAAASLDLARPSGMATPDPDVESGIVAARSRLATQRSEATNTDYLKLAPLFEAGLDSSWYASGLPVRRYTEKAPATRTTAPLVVGPRPDGNILDLRFSADGSKLFSREYDREIEWDVETSAPVSARKPDDPGSLRSVTREQPIAFSDRRRKAIVDGDAILIVDDRTSATVQIMFGEVIKAVGISPDGTKIAVSSAFSSRIRVYATDSGAQIHDLVGHRSKVVSLAWSPDSVALATGSDAGAILIFSPDTSIIATKLSGDVSANGHKAKIETFRFSADSRSLYTLSSAVFERDGDPLRQWDTATRRLIARYPAGRDDMIFVSRDGTRVVTLGSDGADLFSTATPDVVERSLDAPTGAASGDVAVVTAQNVGVISQTYGRGTAAFDIDSGVVKWRREDVSGSRIAADDRGSLIAVADTRRDASLKLLAADDGHEICSSAVKPLLVDGRFAPDPFDVIAFSKDGSEIVGLGMRIAKDTLGLSVISNLARATRWSARNCSLVSDVGGLAAKADRAALDAAFGGDAAAVADMVGTGDDPVVTLRFSPNGKRAFALTEREKLFLYFADGFLPPRQLAVFADDVSELDFSPDGLRLAASSGNGLWLWNAATGELEGEVGRE
jgi:WD40 repeat protein